MVFNRAERITAWRPAPRKIQRARDFSRIPANGIRKGLGHWRAFISLANVNLFRGGHRRDERWRTVVRRHGTFAAKSAFNAAAAVLDRLFTSANPEFRRRSRKRTPPPFPVDGSAIFLTLSNSMKRTRGGWNQKIFDGTPLNKTVEKTFERRSD